jgi:hypothetical protein
MGSKQAIAMVVTVRNRNGNRKKYFLRLNIFQKSNLRMIRFCMPPPAHVPQKTVYSDYQKNVPIGRDFFAAITYAAILLSEH